MKTIQEKFYQAMYYICHQITLETILQTNNKIFGHLQLC